MDYKPFPSSGYLLCSQCFAAIISAVISLHVLIYWAFSVYGVDSQEHRTELQGLCNLI